MVKKFCVLLVLLLLPTTLVAQGAPDQINAALTALSGKVGTTVTLGTLENWTWAQENYPDSGLGCPQPGRAYAQVVTPGYRFELTYGGTIYDYRVSVDSQVVVLCGETAASNTASATATPVPPESLDAGIPCSAPEPGVVYLPTRLTIDMQARVMPGPPNNQRSEPNEQGGLLGEIPGGGIFDILAGPQCANGLVWWQVSYDGRIGWTVEGRDSTYWIEPVPGAALPATRQALSTTNAAGITQLSVTEGNLIDALAVSPDGNTVAVLGGRGTDGVWLYNLQTLDQVPILVRGESTAQLLSLDYNADGSLLLLGDAQGNVRLWDTNVRTNLLETTFLQGHQSDAGAVAFSPDGAFIASVGSIANTIANVNKANAIVLWDVANVEQALVLAGHNARVNALEYSPDGTILASASGDNTGSDNTIRLWNASTGELIATLEGHTGAVQDIAFASDGLSLVSAGLDGSVFVWDIATGEQVRVIQESGVPIRALALSPDGTLLATAAGDPASTNPQDYTIGVWDFAAGQPLVTLQGHTKSIGDVIFSTDGEVLISVSDDHSLRFWGAGALG
jgi:WD40 repeat protein